MIESASKYHNRAHVMLPAAWDGEYVIAVLDKKRDGMKIAHIAVKFGNGAHLILPARGFTVKEGKVNDRR